jgi:hypothetical protein
MKDDMIRKKVDYFFNLKSDVHILTTNNRFYNGTILKISADFILLNELKLGEMPVFFIEIVSIEPRIISGGDGRGGRDDLGNKKQ